MLLLHIEHAISAFVFAVVLAIVVGASHDATQGGPEGAINSMRASYKSGCGRNKGATYTETHTHTQMLVVVASRNELMPCGRKIL